MKTLREHILDLLGKTPDLTRKEIREQLNDTDFDTKQIGNALDALRNYGLVETGETHYEQGRAILTYRLARGVWCASNPGPTCYDPDTTKTYPLSAIQEDTTDETPQPDEGFEHAFADLDQRVAWQAHAIDATVLDSSDKLESALIDLIKQYRAHKHQPPAPTLPNPQRKRDIVNLLTESLLVNPAFKTELAELGQYLDTLDNGEARYDAGLDYMGKQI